MNGANATPVGEGTTTCPEPRRRPLAFPVVPTAFPASPAALSGGAAVTADSRLSVPTEGSEASGTGGGGGFGAGNADKLLKELSASGTATVFAHFAETAAADVKTTAGLFSPGFGEGGGVAILKTAAEVIVAGGVLLGGTAPGGALLGGAATSGGAFDGTSASGGALVGTAAGSVEAFATSGGAFFAGGDEGGTLCGGPTAGRTLAGRALIDSAVLSACIGNVVVSGLV